MRILLKFLFLIFSLISIISSVITSQSNLFFSSLFQESSRINLQSELFLKMMGSENHYFRQNLEEENDSVIGNALQVATNINFKDVRSLMFDEIPGLFSMSSEIIVAGEGTDFTNLPIESSPPIDELFKEREIDEKTLEDLKVDGLKPPIEQPEKKTVFIYHSHSRESFIPHLKDKELTSNVQHKDLNISLVGKRLGEKLMEKGIGVEVDDTDIPSKLHEKGWKYSKSYDASREVVKEAMAANDNFVYFLDIHRDSLKREKTTTTINGKSYAKLYFVVGQGHENYKENEKFARELNQLIKEKYPSISRGVLGKPKTKGSNGLYNQDLSPNSIVIEMGGPENTLEEMYRTADLLADIFAEYYWQDAVEVSGN